MSEYGIRIGPFFGRWMFVMKIQVESGDTSGREQRARRLVQIISEVERWPNLEQTDAMLTELIQMDHRTPAVMAIIDQLLDYRKLMIDTKQFVP